MLLQELLIRFGFPFSYAGDVAFFVLFVIVSVAFGLLVGRFKLVNVLINVYISIAIIGVVPQEIFLLHKYSHIIIFAGSMLILSLVDNHLFDIHMSGSDNSFFWRLFVMSFFEMGLIVSTIMAMFPKKIVLDYVTPEAFVVFAHPYSGLAWTVVPLILLVFINKRQM